MKKTFIAIVAAVSVLAGCEKKTIDHKGYGKFYLGGMDVEQKMNDNGVAIGKDQNFTKSSAFDGMSPEDQEEFLGKFKVSLTSTNPDGYSWTWEKFSEIKDKAIEVPAGTYTLTATSEKTEPAAWNQPIFSGSTTVPVKVGEVTAATVNCSVANMAVTVNCSEYFMVKMDDGFEIKVISKNDKSAFLVWTDDMFDPVTGQHKADKNGEDKEGWFNVDDLDVIVTGKWTLGKDTHEINQHVATLTDLNAKDRVILTVNAQMTGAVGGENGGIKINVDGNVNDKEVALPPVGGMDWEEVPDVPVEPEEPGDEAPSVSWTGIDDFNAMDLQAAIDKKATIYINAPGKIKSLKVKMDSKVLNKILSEVNLAEPGELEQGLEEMLPIGDKVKGQTKLDIGLSGLLPMLYDLCDASSVENDKSSHTFTVILEDENGETFGEDAQAACTFVYNAPASK